MGAVRKKAQLQFSSTNSLKVLEKKPKALQIFDKGLCATQTTWKQP